MNLTWTGAQKLLFTLQMWSQYLPLVNANSNPRFITVLRPYPKKCLNYLTGLDIQWIHNALEVQTPALTYNFQFSTNRFVTHKMYLTENSALTYRVFYCHMN